MGYIITFKVPTGENLIEDWSCFLNGPILLRGRLYLSQNYLCFAANGTTKLFGNESKEVIKLKHVLRIKKRHKYVSGIELLLENGDQLLFSSFLNKSKTFTTLKNVWKNCLKAKYGGPPASSSSSSSASSSMTSSMTSVSTPRKGSAAAAGMSSPETEAIPIPSVHRQTYSTSGSVPDLSLCTETEMTSEMTSVPTTPKGEQQQQQQQQQQKKKKKEEEEEEEVGGNEIEEEAIIEEEKTNDEFKSIASMYTDNNEECAGFLTEGTNMVEVVPPTKIPFSPLVFFYLFFSDHAHEFETQLPLIRKDLSIEPWKVDDAKGGIATREMRYILVLSTLKLPVGPSETRVIDNYRYSLTKDKCIIQRATVSVDIPYGDYFRTESQMTVVAQGDNDYSISVKATTVWHKKSILRGTIESVSIKQIKEQLQAWLKCALDWADKKKDLVESLNKYIEKNAQSPASGPSGSSSRGKKKGKKSSKSSSSKHKKLKSAKRSQQKTSAETLTKKQQQQQQQGGGSSGGGIMSIFYDFVDDLKAIHPVVLVLFALSLVFFIYRLNSLENKISRLAAMTAGGETGTGDLGGGDDDVVNISNTITEANVTV